MICYSMNYQLVAIFELHYFKNVMLIQETFLKCYANGKLLKFYAYRQITLVQKTLKMLCY